MTPHPECTVMGHEDCDFCSGCDRLWQRDQSIAEDLGVVLPDLSIEGRRIVVNAVLARAKPCAA
jgi:hypothetical protein